MAEVMTGRGIHIEGICEVEASVALVDGGQAARRGLARLFGGQPLFKSRQLLLQPDRQRRWSASHVSVRQKLGHMPLSQNM